ncbi:GIY-YIG nuclease family protein [Ferruginibacter albus]|uniref:GIY-YIG nuclease family protein n=1 Tax=Ferruginibacter albus TaxID=2875540 RepID=UPI001CC80EF6|nr:GIY-YIG nuclease family protein [Ferruginibacter albus]
MDIIGKYCVYIFECSDNSYYTSFTNNIERRLWEHNNKENKLSQRLMAMARLRQAQTDRF